MADWSDEGLAPKGFGVVLAFVHVAAGVKVQGSRTVSSAVYGLLRFDGRSREEFLTLTGISRWSPTVIRSRVGKESL